jgi:uncharacterized protein (TIGR01244 family)
MEANMKMVLSLLVMLAVVVAPAAAQSKVTKETVPGITNYLRLETTVACAGAITADSVPEIKKAGFVSIINLREATEQGANVEAEAEAAKKAGIRYYHVPFNGGKPTTAAVDSFLKAISNNGAEPAFIHCAGGNRAAAMWFAKRAVLDKWPVDKAMAEAADLGFTNPALKTFMTEYVKTHQK